MMAENGKGSGDIQNPSEKGHDFNMIEGVFLPSILTMLGAIMFLRVNFVTGNAGIYYSLVILFGAASIVLSTALSISAISSNTKVKGGGVYYLISRTLGPGFGGSIGLTLFLAQGISIPFNILGFAEALCSDFSVLAPYYFWISLGAGIVLMLITFSGADLAMKCQIFIFFALMLGIFDMFLGAGLVFKLSTFHENATPAAGVNNWMMFALFFPAVTGIMAGVNMSGDLKNPSKDIPRGILYTILFGGVLYLIQIIICGGAFSRQELVTTPYKIMVNNAPLSSGYLVSIGVAAATISTALGLFLCAPRVLQALARDTILPSLNFLGKGYGKHNEPVRATCVLSAMVIGIIIWAGAQGLSKDGTSGGMNTVAEIASMCFLLTYAMVNLAAFVESYGANPSFRPRFKFFHWSFALYGFIACIAVSFFINFLAASAAMVVAGLLFIYIKRRKYEADFGDARRGFIYSRIRENLLSLSRIPSHPKNWRPTMVILSREPEKQMHLAYFASLLESKRGLISMATFIEKPDIVPEDMTTRSEKIQSLKDMMWSQGIFNVFPEVVFCQEYNRALRVFLQAHMLGPLKPNIVMMGFPDNKDRVVQNLSHMRIIKSLRMSCILMHNFGDEAARQPSRIVRGHIDLWWRGIPNLSLMLILAHLLVSDPLWQGIQLRILRVSRPGENADEVNAELEDIIDSARIDAEPKTIYSDDSFSDVMRRESADASAIFLGFSLPDSEEETFSMFEMMSKYLEGMPPTFLVFSSGEADLRV